MNLHRDVLYLIKTFKDAKGDGEISVVEVLTLTQSVSNLIIKAIEGFQSSKEFNQLVEDCEKLYDELIAPINLEGVNDWIEPRVDSMIRNQIRPALTKLVEDLM